MPMGSHHPSQKVVAQAALSQLHGAAAVAQYAFLTPQHIYSLSVHTWLGEHVCTSQHVSATLESAGSQAITQRPWSSWTS